MSRNSSASRFLVTLIIQCVVVILPQRLHSQEFLFPPHYHGKEPPVFVAHRGDKALLPEHTIAGYVQAMLQDVSFVEPDLTLTKDQVLVCHHDLTLTATTDVSSIPEFASLMRNNVNVSLEGHNVTIVNDWFVIDFTLKQLRKLRVSQQVKGIRPQHFNQRFRIPTFQEYIDAVHHDTWWRVKTRPNETFIMGMMPELKSPDYHNSYFGEDYLMERIFLTELRKNGYLDDTSPCEYKNDVIPCSPLVVQCFDVNTIKYLSATTNLRLTFLLEGWNWRYLTYQGMADLENKCEYLGIWKEHLYMGTPAVYFYKDVQYDSDEVEKLGGFIEPENIVDYANGLGFKVGIYTIYESTEDSKRGCAKQCVNDTKEMELLHYFDMGVELFFIEGICESFRIRDKYFPRINGSSGKGGDEHCADIVDSVSMKEAMASLGVEY